MRKLVISAALAASFLVAGPQLTSVRQADAATYLDYTGENLFLGLAYHRWACITDDSYNVISTNTYQGFTGTQHCTVGSWSSNKQDIYLGWAPVSDRGQNESWLGYYFCYANWDYGLTLTSANSSEAQSGDGMCYSWKTSYQNNSTANIGGRSNSNAPNQCSYNVLNDCNSDCWIKDFSNRQGGMSDGSSHVDIASGCW